MSELLLSTDTYTLPMHSLVYPEERGVRDIEISTIWRVVLGDVVLEQPAYRQGGELGEERLALSAAQASGLLTYYDRAHVQDAITPHCHHLVSYLEGMGSAWEERLVGLESLRPEQLEEGRIYSVVNRTQEITHSLYALSGSRNLCSVGGQEHGLIILGNEDTLWLYGDEFRRRITVM